jgi:UDP-N-acetylglucosamine transferase subunit ALG13
MNRLLVGRVLSLGLLVVLVVFALGACGGDEKKAKARPLPEDPKALRPGTYRSEEFKPSLSFHVGKGWSSAPLEASDVLVIAQGETKVIGFVKAQEVYKPTRTGTPNVVDAPEDMVGWFQQHPYLQTDKPEPVTVGGVKGMQFDVVVEDLPEDYSVVCSGCGVGSGVGIFRLSTGYPVAFREADKSRLIVLEDVKGETVTLGFSSPATEFDEFAPEAQKVIDTVKWTGS